MFKSVCLFLIVDKPLYGTPECQEVLKKDCSTYAPEPVCAHNGDVNVTYDNSCYFAQGICGHHGHAVYANHPGPCV